jgi:hypothetical protein
VLIYIVQRTSQATTVEGSMTICVEGRRAICSLGEQLTLEHGRDGLRNSNFMKPRSTYGTATRTLQTINEYADATNNYGGDSGVPRRVRPPVVDVCCLFFYFECFHSYYICSHGWRLMKIK